MSRGRKPKAENTDLNWQEYFNKNVGVYLQTIIIELGQLKKCGTDSSVELLNEIKNEKLKTNKKVIVFPKINSEEIPFTIPKNWVWCRLGEVIEFTDNLNIETKFSKDTLINYVDIDAIDNQNHKIRENKLKPVAELSSRARRVLRKGYIVYSLVRPYLNNIAIVEEEYPNHIGSTGFAVFNGLSVNNTYLKYILLSDYVRQLYLSMLSGFNSPTITQEQFNLTPIPLPPISEQNKILEFFSDFESENIDESITYFNKQVEEKILELHNSQLLSSELFAELSFQLNQIENLNQAILQEAVQGKLVPQNPTDEPATELLQRIKAEKEKLGKKEKPLPPIKPDEIPFEIPKSWVWCKINDLVLDYKNDIRTGPFGTALNKSEHKDQGIPVWGIESISKDGRFTNHNKIFVSEQKAIDLKSFYVKGGDLIISRSGTIGELCMLPYEIRYGLLSTNLMKISVNREVIMPEYFCHIIKGSAHIKEMLADLCTGSTRLFITQGILSELIFPLPPLSEQKRIVAEIEQQLAKTNQLKAHIVANQQATEQLLKALLHQAFEVGGNE